MSRAAQLKEMLSNLGSRIRSVDDAYAQRVSDLIYPKTADAKYRGTREVIDGLVAQPLFRGPTQAEFNLDEMRGLVSKGIPVGMAENVVGYLPVATSAAVRYGIPAAGLTAAGQALANLTGDLYDTASETPILPM